MTSNQIRYQELLATKRRDEINAQIGLGTLYENVRHNMAVESETGRHNTVVEDQAYQQLVINKQSADANTMNAFSNRMNAETNRLNYGVNLMNAETNRLNYGVNLMNAESNRISANASAMNAQANMYNAETNRLNAQTNFGQLLVAQRNADVNAMNAATNARNAAVNERNATVNERNATSNAIKAEVSRALMPSQIRLNNAQIGNIHMNTNLAQSRIFETQAQVRSLDASATATSGKNTREWISLPLNLLGSLTQSLGNLASGFKNLGFQLDYLP